MYKRQAIHDLNQDINLPELNSPNRETVFFEIVDSISILNLMLDLEDQITNQLGDYVQLADESVMDASNSSFKTVGGIIDHVTTKIAKNGTDKI